jgi:hypothetical protein
MNVGLLSQGQPLKSLYWPDYNAEGAGRIEAGVRGCTGIAVSQLCGPMGFYDVAVVTFDDHRPPSVHPLHQCEAIEI